MRQGLLQPPKAALPEDESTEATDNAAEESAETGGAEQASPQEQKQYDELMGTFYGLIHSGDTKAKVIEQLKSAGPDIGRVIGEMSMAMFSATEGQIEKKGGSIPDSVRMEAGQDLVTELVQMAVLLKVVPDDEDAIGKTISAAIDVFGSAYGNARRDAGAVDPQAMQGDLETLKGAAQQEFGGPQSPMAAGVKDAGAKM